MALECEAKLRVQDLERIRTRLDKLGAANEGECLERNWVLDDAMGGLARRGILLRIRNVGGAGGILTIKTPVAEGEFKRREEIESMVDSTRDLLKQFQILGYEVAWIYEKYRQTWLWRDCVLALDECPEIGSFIEIEGAPEHIRQVAVDLDLNPEDHIRDTYLGLWAQHLNDLGQPHRDMVFSRSESDLRRSRSTVTTRVGMRRT